MKMSKNKSHTHLRGWGDDVIVKLISLFSILFHQFFSIILVPRIIKKNRQNNIAEKSTSHFHHRGNMNNQRDVFSARRSGIFMFHVAARRMAFFFRKKNQKTFYSDYRGIITTIPNEMKRLFAS